MQGPRSALYAPVPENVFDDHAVYRPSKPLHDLVHALLYHPHVLEPVLVHCPRVREIDLEQRYSGHALHHAHQDYRYVHGRYYLAIRHDQRYWSVHDHAQYHHAVARDPVASMNP